MAKCPDVPNINSLSLMLHNLLVKQRLLPLNGLMLQQHSKYSMLTIFSILSISMVLFEWQYYPLDERNCLGMRQSKINKVPIRALPYIASNNSGHTAQPHQ